MLVPYYLEKEKEELEKTPSGKSMLIVLGILIIVGIHYGKSPFYTIFKFIEIFIIAGICLGILFLPVLKK